MTFLNNLLGDGKTASIVLIVVGLLVLLLLAFAIYRLTVGRGLKAAPGARARQPRLGIVDAFDLDRQRQLVLVRRDNVEHLIMIGGPNDLLIEPAIVRAVPVGATDGRRDAPIAAPQAPAAATPPASERPPARMPNFDAPRERDMPEPKGPEPRAPNFDLPPRESQIEPNMAPLPLPPIPRPAPAPSPAGEGGPSTRPAPPAVRPMPAPTPRPIPAAPALRPAPPPRPPLGGPAAPPLGRPAQPGPSIPMPSFPAPVVPPPPPMQAEAPPPSPPAPAPRVSVDIDSLEEEMAKLLGRPPSDPNRG